MSLSKDSVLIALELLSLVRVSPMEPDAALKIEKTMNAVVEFKAELIALDYKGKLDQLEEAEAAEETE